MGAPSDAELRRAGTALALGFALGLVLLLVARRDPAHRAGGTSSG